MNALNSRRRRYMHHHRVSYEVAVDQRIKKTILKCIIFCVGETIKVYDKLLTMRRQCLHIGLIRRMSHLAIKTGGFNYFANNEDNQATTKGLLGPGLLNRFATVKVM